MFRTLVTGPSGSVVSTADIKAHLYVDFSDDDTLLDGLVESATVSIENYLGRKLRTEVWDFRYTNWASASVVRAADVSAFTSVKYYDTEEVEQTLSSDNYFVEYAYNSVYWTLVDAASYPEVSRTRKFPITIRLSMGYATASDVPEPIKLALKNLVGFYYSHREVTVVGAGIVKIDLPLTFKAILSPYKLMKV